MSHSEKLLRFRPILLFFLVILSYHTQAFELGELHVFSQPNAPLEAEIEILNVTENIPLQHINASLASFQQYKRAGLSYLPVHQKLHILPSVNFQGQPVILIYSDEPLGEPQLDMLIEVIWPNGSILSHYSLKPTAVKATEETLEPSESSENLRITQMPKEDFAKIFDQLAQAQTGTSSEETLTDAVPRLTRQTYGPITYSDTLWRIAETVRPSTTTSIQKTMLALLEKNPHAFVTPNINHLRIGSTLSVPSTEEINHYSENEAVQLIRSQNETWLTMTPEEREAKANLLANNAADNVAALDSPNQPSDLQVTTQSNASTEPSQPAQPEINLEPQHNERLLLDNTLSPFAPDLSSQEDSLLVLPDYIHELEMFIESSLMIMNNEINALHEDIQTLTTQSQPAHNTLTQLQQENDEIRTDLEKLEKKSDDHYQELLQNIEVTKNEMAERVKISPITLTIIAGTLILLMSILWVSTRRPQNIDIDEVMKKHAIKGTKPSEPVESDDTTGAQLDLASAYIDIGDYESAQEILQHIVKDGHSGEQAEAQKLLKKLNANAKSSPTSDDKGNSN